MLQLVTTERMRIFISWKETSFFARKSTFFLTLEQPKLLKQWRKPCFFRQMTKSAVLVHLFATKCWMVKLKRLSSINKLFQKKWKKTSSVIMNNQKSSFKSYIANIFWTSITGWLKRWIIVIVSKKKQYTDILYLYSIDTRAIRFVIDIASNHFDRFKIWL